VPDNWNPIQGNYEQVLITVPKPEWKSEFYLKVIKPEWDKWNVEQGNLEKKLADSAYKMLMEEKALQDKAIAD